MRLVLGEYGVPYLMKDEDASKDTPLTRVPGELWVVDDEGLDALDVLEGVSVGMYERVTLEVEVAGEREREGGVGEDATAFGYVAGAESIARGIGSARCETIRAYDLATHERAYVPKRDRPATSLVVVVILKTMDATHANAATRRAWARNRRRPSERFFFFLGVLLSTPTLHFSSMYSRRGTCRRVSALQRLEDLVPAGVEVRNQVVHLASQYDHLPRCCASPPPRRRFCEKSSSSSSSSEFSESLPAEGRVCQPPDPSRTLHFVRHADARAAVVRSRLETCEHTSAARFVAKSPED